MQRFPRELLELGDLTRAHRPPAVVGPRLGFALLLLLLSSRSVASDSATPWTAARQASLCFTSSRRLLQLLSVESLTPSSHLILCYPLLLLPPVPPSIRVFSNESTLCMRWPKYGLGG